MTSIFTIIIAHLHPVRKKKGVLYGSYYPTPKTGAGIWIFMQAARFLLLRLLFFDATPDEINHNPDGDRNHTGGHDQAHGD